MYVFLGEQIVTVGRLLFIYIHPINISNHTTLELDRPANHGFIGKQGHFFLVQGANHQMLILTSETIGSSMSLPCTLD